MRIPFTNGANPFTLDVGLLCEVVAKSMSCFSLTLQQAGTLVESIIDLQVAYSGNPATLEDFLRGALYLFNLYENKLQMLYKEAQPQSGEYQSPVDKEVSTFDESSSPF